MPPPGALSPLAVRRDRLRVGLEGLGAKVGPRAYTPRTFTARIAPTSPFPPGAVERYLSALAAPAATGPPAPDAAVDLDGLCSVRPDRAAPPGRGPALVHGR